MLFRLFNDEYTRRLASLLTAVPVLLGLASGCGDDEDPGTQEDEIIQGVDGEDGEDGAPGVPGVDGEDGEDGAPSEPGADGMDGEDGLDGDAGVDGDDGDDGEPGDDGAPGAVGAVGPVGPAGPAGPVGPTGPTGPAGGGPVVEPEGVPQVLPLSLAGHDRLFGVVYGDDGSFYATGQIANDITSDADYSLVVAKFDASGELDETFGNGGVALKNVAVGGTSRENARGIVLQSDHKIVIAGAAEHDPDAEGVLATDTDIVLVRFNIDGSLDTTFGENGVVTLDLNEGLVGTNTMGQPTLSSGDSQWSLSLADDDKLVVHGTQRGEGFQMDGVTPRNDADFALVRLTSEGVLDTSFSEDGKVLLDLQNAAGASAGASSRAANVLEDGSIVAAGYINSDVLGESTQQPLLYKVDVGGDFDESFATEDAWGATGVWHDTAVEPPLRAEAYGAAVQSDGSLVTMGYGPTDPAVHPTGMGSDWISFRFTPDGAFDTSYGTNGATYIDAGGYADNGRFVMVLPDDRILGVGLGRAAGATSPEADAMVAVLTADGQPDETFAPGGFRLYDVGGTADHFWAGALSPSGAYVAVVGIAGAETSGIHDDDAVVLLIPVD